MQRDDRFNEFNEETPLHEDQRSSELRYRGQDKEKDNDSELVFENARPRSSMRPFLKFLNKIWEQFSFADFFKNSSAVYITWTYVEYTLSHLKNPEYYDDIDNRPDLQQLEPLFALILGMILTLLLNPGQNSLASKENSVAKYINSLTPGTFISKSKSTKVKAFLKHFFAFGGAVSMDIAAHDWEMNGNETQQLIAYGELEDVSHATVAPRWAVGYVVGIIVFVVGDLISKGLIAVEDRYEVFGRLAEALGLEKIFGSGVATSYQGIGGLSSDEEQSSDHEAPIIIEEENPDTEVKVSNNNSAMTKNPSDTENQTGSSPKQPDPSFFKTKSSEKEENKEEKEEVTNTSLTFGKGSQEE